MMKKLILLLFITAANCRIIEVSQNLNHAKKNNQWNKILQIEKKGMIHRQSEEETNRFKQNLAQAKLTDSEKINGIAKNPAETTQIDLLKNDIYKSGFLNLTDQVLKYSDNASAEIDNSSEGTNPESRNVKINEKLEGSAAFVEPDQVYDELDDTHVNYKISEECIEGCSESFPYRKTSQESGFLDSDGNGFEGSGASNLPDWVLKNSEDSISTEENSHDQNNLLFGDNIIKPYQNTTKQEQNILQPDQDVERSDNSADSLDHITIKSIEEPKNHHHTYEKPVTNSEKLNVDAHVPDQEYQPYDDGFKNFNFSDSKIEPNDSFINDNNQAHEPDQLTFDPVRDDDETDIFNLEYVLALSILAGKLKESMSDEEFQQGDYELEKFNLNDSKTMSNNSIINNDNPAQVPDQDIFNPDRNINKINISYLKYVFDPLSLSNEYQASMPDQDLFELVDVVSETNTSYPDQEHFTDLNNSSVVTINFKDQVEPDIHIINFNISDKPDQFKNKTSKYINFLKKIGIDVDKTHKPLRNSTNNDTNTNKFSETVIVLNVPLDDKQDN